MKNGEKYKTPDERDSAFRKFCGKHECESCDLDISDKFWCTFAWLDLEAEEEEILPCPFCGSECTIHYNSEGCEVRCKMRYKSRCCYTGKEFESEAEAIAAHNRVAKAVMEIEAKHD